MKKISILFFLIAVICASSRLSAQEEINVSMPAPSEPIDLMDDMPLSVDITNEDIPEDELYVEQDPQKQEILSSLAQNEVFPDEPQVQPAPIVQPAPEIQPAPAVEPAPQPMEEQPIPFVEAPQQPQPMPEQPVQPTNIPFEQFTNSSAAPSINGQPVDVVEKNELIVIPSDSKYLHPLLSLDFSDSLFTKLSELENEKFVLDLETKHKQMELELSKLKRDQLKLDNEIRKLEQVSAESSESVSSAPSDAGPSYVSEVSTPVQPEDSSKTFEVTSVYEIKSIMGIGGNLTATLLNIPQNKKITVRQGTTIGDGIIVRSISPQDGIVFEKGKKLYPLKMKQN